MVLCILCSTSAPEVSSWAVTKMLRVYIVWFLGFEKEKREESAGKGEIFLLVLIF